MLGVHVLLMLFVFMYAYQCLCILVSNTISMSFNRTVTWQVSHMEQELLTLPEHLSSLSVFSGLPVARSLVFCVVFCISLFVLLSFLSWPLYCLSRLDLRLLITLQTFLNKQHYTKRTIIIIVFKYLIHKQL